MRIKTISKKRVNADLEIRREHVTYDDGRTEDRFAYYNLFGEFLSTSLKEAQTKVNQLIKRSRSGKINTAPQDNKRKRVKKVLEDAPYKFDL